MFNLVDTLRSKPSDSNRIAVLTNFLELMSLKKNDGPEVATRAIESLLKTFASDKTRLQVIDLIFRHSAIKDTTPGVAEIMMCQIQEILMTMNTDHYRTRVVNAIANSEPQLAHILAGKIVPILKCFATDFSRIETMEIVFVNGLHVNLFIEHVREIMSVFYTDAFRIKALKVFQKFEQAFKEVCDKVRARDLPFYSTTWVLEASKILNQEDLNPPVKRSKNHIHQLQLSSGRVTISFKHGELTAGTNFMGFIDGHMVSVSGSYIKYTPTTATTTTPTTDAQVVVMNGFKFTKITRTTLLEMFTDKMISLCTGSGITFPKSENFIQISSNDFSCVILSGDVAIDNVYVGLSISEDGTFTVSTSFAGMQTVMS